MLPQRDPHSPRFGIIAVKLGYITPTQLRQAMIMQLDDDMEERPHRLLGVILFDLDWISAEQRDEVLEKTRRCYSRTETAQSDAPD